MLSRWVRRQYPSREQCGISTATDELVWGRVSRAGWTLRVGPLLRVRSIRQALQQSSAELGGKGGLSNDYRGCMSPSIILDDRSILPNKKEERVKSV